jgi:hypothetical protein
MTTYEKRLDNINKFIFYLIIVLALYLIGKIPGKGMPLLEVSVQLLVILAGTLSYRYWLKKSVFSER